MRYSNKQHTNVKLNNGGRTLLKYSNCNNNKGMTGSNLFISNSVVYHTTFINCQRLEQRNLLKKFALPRIHVKIGGQHIMLSSGLYSSVTVVESKGEKREILSHKFSILHLINVSE